MKWLAPTVLVAAALVPAPARALDRPLDECSVEHWRSRDGLPGDQVKALAQARDGQLWIATLGGLARWDGVAFQRVTVPGDEQAHETDVRLLLASRDGSVWAGSPYFAPLRFGEGLAPVIATNTQAWAEDATGALWMMLGGKLKRVLGGRLVDQAMEGLAGRRPTELLVDRAGTVWLGTDRGLFTLVGSRLQPQPAVTDAVSALHQDRRGAIWVAAGPRLVMIEGGRTTVAFAGTAPIVALSDDDDGYLWFGSSDGLGRVRQGKIERFTASDGLPENDVTAVLVDREGTLWVGTHNGGLAQFTDRTLSTHEVPALEGQEVVSVAEDDEGAMWFGTRQSGAIRWLNRKATSYGTKQGLPSDLVHTLLPGDAGEVWLGTEGGLRLWRRGVIVDPGWWTTPVLALYRDHEGALWIGGSGELGRMSGGKLIRYTADDGLPARQVRNLGEDAGGAIWVGGVGGQVVRLEGGRFVRPELLGGRKINPVRSMLTDRRGLFWISGDRTGLWQVRGDGEARMVGASDGLEAEIVYQLLEDQAGDVWIGTNRSIARLGRASLDAWSEGRRAGLEVVSYESTDRHAGVVAMAVRQPSAWRAHDGRLWFVTQQGMVTVDPRQVRPNPVPPSVVITGVLADGRRLDGADEVPARPRRLEVHYQARALLEPGKVRYRYRLEGVDGSWIEAGPSRLASYANLPSGTFRFRVQAANNDRLWNEEGAAVSLVIAAPVYRRPWFFAVSALGVLPILFGWHRVRVSRLRAHYVGMFTERGRVARELHDTILQGMSGIAMQLGAIRMRRADLPEETRRELDGLQNTVVQCLEECRRAVWDLRDAARESDLGSALARFARRLYRAPGIQCNVSVEGTARALPTSLEDELFRIAQEALRNAAAHASATLVEVKLRYLPDAIALSVRDDGRGFDAATASRKGHFGLAGIRERAARIFGRLEISSTPAGGTSIEIIAPTKAQ